MQEYVVVFARSAAYPDEVLLIEKDRPEWQKGRYNLPGGKVENGEDILTAARRELQEETGIETSTLTYVKKVGTIIGNWGIVHVIKVDPVSHELNPREGETERPFWVRWNDVKDSKNLIPNIKVMIPLIREGVEGWKIRDEEKSAGKAEHQFSITVKTGWTEPEVCSSFGADPDLKQYVTIEDRGWKPHE